jgi:hypothetical protein
VWCRMSVQAFGMTRAHQTRHVSDL